MELTAKEARRLTIEKMYYKWNHKEGSTWDNKRVSFDLDELWDKVLSYINEGIHNGWCYTVIPINNWFPAISIYIATKLEDLGYFVDEAGEKESRNLKITWYTVKE